MALPIPTAEQLMTARRLNDHFMKQLEQLISKGNNPIDEDDNIKIDDKSSADSLARKILIINFPVIFPNGLTWKGIVMMNHFLDICLPREE